MISFGDLPMIFKTLIATALFLTTAGGICISILVSGKQGRRKQFFLLLCTAIPALMLVLYASVIPAERAKANIPGVSLWFAGQPVLFSLLIWLPIVLFFVMVVIEERNRRKSSITPSSIKESLDHLETGLCFAYPNGLVMLTNHRMDELSHEIFAHPLQNANLFWDSLVSKDPSGGTVRIAGGNQPEFRLPDGTIWTFQREVLNGAIQIVAADTTEQHRLVDDLQEKNLEQEEMNARIRSYGSKVDEYVTARERLETRINLHGFLGQALLMTRHYLLYGSGSPEKIIDIWQRNVDVLRLEAEPQQNTDSLASLTNAAEAIGMRVHVQGALPAGSQFRKMIAATGAEALTNAVRHASAKQLWIDVSETDSEYIIRYTNDGNAPASKVTEGGGLSTARKKIEAAGGRMQVEFFPRFILTMIFGKEVNVDV